MVFYLKVSYFNPISTDFLRRVKRNSSPPKGLTSQSKRVLLSEINRVCGVYDQHSCEQPVNDSMELAFELFFQDIDVNNIL